MDNGYLKWFTYLIYDGRYYKIGHSTNVERRLNELTIMSKTKLQLIYSNETSFGLETILHKKFRCKRVFDEWFDLSQEEIKIACDMIRGQYKENQLPDKICPRCKQVRNYFDFKMHHFDQEHRQRSMVCVYCDDPELIDEYSNDCSQSENNLSDDYISVRQRVKRMESQMGIIPFPKFKHPSNIVKNDLHAV